MLLTVTHADEVMDEFRKNFPLVCRCFVWDEGRKMNYYMAKVEGAEKYEAIAKDIIEKNNLPLEVRLPVYERGHEGFGIVMNIIYKNTES